MTTKEGKMSERKKTHRTFTLYRSFLTNLESYGSGESGWAILHINTPCTVIGIAMTCPEKTFIVNEILIGDTNYLLGNGPLRAEQFSPRLEDLEDEGWFQHQEMQRGEVIIVRFKNVYSDGREPITVSAKVEQERTP